jgi:DNA-directed RNA polymerase specialized sigma24 family protein
MHDDDRLAQRFEEHRAHLRAAAYRMLGSVSEAADAVSRRVEALYALGASRDGQLDYDTETIMGPT